MVNPKNEKKTKKIMFLGLPLDRNTGVSVAQKNYSDALNLSGYDVDQINTYHKDKFELISNNKKQMESHSLDNLLEGLYDDYDNIHVHSYIWSAISKGANITDIIRKVKAPLTYTFHSQQINKNLEQENIAKNADALLFLTRYERDKYLQKHNHQNPIVVPNTINFQDVEVDSELLSEKKRQYLPEEKIILYTGRFSPEKGSLELAQALRYMHKQGLPVKSIWIGRDSKSSPGIEKELRNTLVPGTYEFPGWLSHDEQAIYHKLADLKVIPSINEAFCLSAMESINYGLPIAVTNIAPLKELYLDHDAAIEIKEPKPKQIAETINQYSKNEDVWRKNTALAKDKFKSMYSPETVGKQLASAYKK